MSTANLIPETRGRTGDEAKETLARVGRRRLIGDALKRLRFSDGFSHARSMAFLGILLFVEGVIAVVGIASILGNQRISHAIARDLQSVVPGPAGRILTQAANQAHQAASSGHWVAIAFGTIAALITGTTMMGQVERAMNRLYGIESDRPTARKYAHAFLLALTAGTLSALAFIALGLGGVLANSIGTSSTHTIWIIARWPLGIALLVASMAVLLKWAPRRHQPTWSWMSFGALARRRSARPCHGRAQRLLPLQHDVRIDLRPAGGHHRPGPLGVRDGDRVPGRRRARRAAGSRARLCRRTA